MYMADRTIHFKEGKVVSVERPSFMNEYRLTIKNGKITKITKIDPDKKSLRDKLSEFKSKITYQQIVGAATFSIGMTTIAAFGIGEGALIAILGAAYTVIKLPE